MKLRLFALTACLGLFLGANAQANLDQKAKREGVVKGSIVKDGKEQKGYIKKIIETREFLVNSNVEHKYYEFKAYDNFQSFIYFIPKDVFDSTETIQSDMYIKYSPNIIEGYTYIYPNGETVVYESVMYSDKLLKVIKQPIFLKIESKGQLIVYTYYIAPPLIGATLEDVQWAEEPQILFGRTNWEEVKTISSINIKKDFADCSKIVAKYKNGEYGSTVGKAGNDSKIVKMADGLDAKDRTKLAAIVDYDEGLCD